MAPSTDKGCSICPAIRYAALVSITLGKRQKGQFQVKRGTWCGTFDDTCNIYWD